MLGKVQFTMIAGLLLSMSGCIVMKQPGECDSCDRIFIGDVGPHSQDLLPAEMPCELYDRKEVLKRWLQAAKPSNYVPQPIQNFGARVRDKGYQWHLHQQNKCDELRAWYEMKKMEANAPPWPKFHPLPSRPVFSPVNESQPDQLDLQSPYGTIATELL